MNHLEFLSNNCDKQLYGYQLELFQHDNLIADTSRQIGFSYLAALKIAYELCTKTDVKIAYFVPYSSNNIINEVVDIINTFKDENKQDFLIKNKSLLRCTNGNTLEIISSKGYSNYKAKSFTHMFITELDFSNISVDELIYVYNTQGHGGECNLWAWSVVNTGKLCELKAKIKNIAGSKFRFYNLPWYVVPGRGIPWINRVKDCIGEEQFNHEYIGKFDLYGSY